ncbi:MAG: hypothetical protein AB7O97_08230 [Planctomycetota bacterium]
MTHRDLAPAPTSNPPRIGRALLVLVVGAVLFAAAVSAAAPAPAPANAAPPAVGFVAGN